jgi:cation transport regulator ChaB
MPYARNADIPADVRQRFTSEKCQTLWRQVWNDVFARHGDEGRAFATAETAGQNCMAAAKSALDKEHPMDLAVKSVGPDTIEGLAVPFSVDTDGERFTPQTDLCLDWFGKSGRPLLYDHGLERTGRGAPDPGTVKMGMQVEYEERPDGLWAQAQLDRNNRYRKAVDRLIGDGALGFSSGSMGHLARVNKASGIIERWPWVELSMTPIHANLDTVVHHYVKSSDLFSHLEDTDTDITSFLKAALGAVLDDERNADPDTGSLDDKAGRVSAAVDEFRDHVRAAADMRAKAGRVLSAANRDRIAKALASKEAVLAAYSDLESLLSETDPQAADAAKAALWQAVIEAEVTLARSRGVPVPMK